MSQHQYDPRYEPPAPILFLRLSPPEGAPSIGLPALVDTGADVSVVPEAVAQSLGLPIIGQLHIRGVGGQAQAANVHAATVECAGVTALCEVVGFGDEALLGRDLLNRWTMVLDGLHQVLELRGQADC